MAKQVAWIDPSKLKLIHRIGRGRFGDVWLATHHQSTEDYDAVAVKMLHPIREHSTRVVWDKLEEIFNKFQGVRGVCWLYGTSIINGKICIIMKLYEGSVGDEMAHLRGGKLSLPDVLRYGISLAAGIYELHSKGFLVLNLKPSNVLLNENDQAVLGDLGIPYLLLGIPLISSDMTRTIGTPNYMAPEQWQPEVRGPVSYETDSWGFGCSIVEMLTGVRPWGGKSVDEISYSVNRKQEKPDIPGGLPPAIENLLLGCFEYDLRSRPLITDILRVFKSLQNAVTSSTGYTAWVLSKDHLQVGDTVRSRKPPNSCKPGKMYVPEGAVVGVDRDTDEHGLVLVRVHGIHDPLKVPVTTLERVTFGLTAGDWVRLKKEDKKHSPVGILHSIARDGNVEVGFTGLGTLWKGNSAEFQMAGSYCVGQFVRLRANVLSPRFEWPRKWGGAWATGRISWILPNGGLVVQFPRMLTFGDENSIFVADPAEVELVTFDTCPGMLEKYLHLADFHWAVRPLVLALGLFAAWKLGRSKVEKRETRIGYQNFLELF